MEHIVQFAIGIDDKAIQNRIEEYAYKDVLDKIVKETMDTVFARTNAYSREDHDGGSFAKLPRRTQGRDYRQGREHACRPVPTDEEISGSHRCRHRKGW
mgnify:CR=1 FL=1